MNSKIKVDPKTFKIINQQQDKESLSSDPETTTSLASESSSGSDSESIKVIKLGGGNSQPQTSQKNTLLQSNPPQQQRHQQQPPQQQPHQQQPHQQQPPQQQPPQQKPSQPQQSQPQPVSNARNIENYLSSVGNNDDDALYKEELVEESIEDTGEKSSEESIVEPKIEAVAEPDVIDLSQSKLFDILHSIFTDSNGISVSENIEKMSKLFDKHNQIMEKILNQLIIMNSNHKQIRIPDAVQTNTKIASNDFRNTNN